MAANATERSSCDKNPLMTRYLITDLDLRPLAEGGNLGGHGCRETLERLPTLPRIGTSGCRVGVAGSLAERPSRQALGRVGRRTSPRQTAGGAVLEGPARRRTEAAGSQVGQATWPACSSQCAAADRRDLRRTVAFRTAPLAAIDT